MSIVTMNMSSYEIEYNDSCIHADEYRECYPALALQLHKEDLKPMPPDLTPVDAETFIQRMYTYRRH